ncbi:restriction endonuclease subunit S [Bellilinea sp.]|uniref:restriction endonuclease subunit S n=1 Tax=Bellilinea sp. TaxID=2838785 RepID=UPI002ADDD1B8|nr:restriction endonuclease subunit S [Bellilinea sp.]
MRKKEIFTAENTENAEVDSVASVRSVANTDDLPDGFQMTELGPLPKEWRVVGLGEVVEKTRQLDPGKNPDWSFKYIDVSSVDNELLRIITYQNFIGEKAPSRARKSIKAGDVLFATVRPYLKRVAMVPSELDGHICSTAFCVLRAKSEIDAYYLFFAVSQDSFVQRVAEHQRGSSYPAVTDQDVLRQFIPLPPLAEQRAIAHVLRTVQRAKEAADGVIAALKDLKKSLMQHLFTYGPVPVTERERVAMQESELGPLPAHWRVVRLGEVAEKTRQLDPCKTPDWSFKYVDVSSIDNESLRITRCQSFIGKEAPSRARKQIKFGDVLFATVRPYLKRIAMVPSELDGQICSTAFCVLRAKSEIDACYLFFAVSQESFVQRIVEYQRGSSYPAVTDQDLLRELIPLPPLDEQREIARILQAVDARIAAGQARRAALEELFKTLLHVLMSARIRLPAEFVIQFEE